MGEVCAIWGRLFSEYCHIFCCKALELDPEIVLDWVGYKLDGGRIQTDTIENALKNTLFLDQKGLSEKDSRPLHLPSDEMSRGLK
jgi:hypothetical protein